jgi:hypothetical protein
MLAATLVPAAAAAPPRPAQVAPVAVAEHTLTGHPLKVLLVGDSVAGSLGVGLAAEAPAYGVQLVNEGTPGCALSTQSSIKVLWYSVPASPPCAGGKLLGTWRNWVDAYNPDVVVYLARGDLFDQQVGTKWTNVLDPSFDQYLRRRFESADRVLGARGAAVVLMTTPVYDSGEQGSGQPWPEDDPPRTASDNAVILSAARNLKPHVVAFPLGSMLTPGNAYRDVVDGVTTRCVDGVHFTAAAGEWLAPRLFPQLVRLGAQHRSLSPAGEWPGPVPASTPGWWSKLSC